MGINTPKRVLISHKFWHASHTLAQRLLPFLSQRADNLHSSKEPQNNLWRNEYFILFCCGRSSTASGKVLLFTTSNKRLVHGVTLFYVFSHGLRDSTHMHLEC